MNGIVIIPVYQPERCLEQLVDELCEAGDQVIVVDDGSDEKSQKYFWRLGEKAIILHHEENRGKGAAIKTALTYIQDDLWDYDVVGIMDGDGQHLVSDMERLIYKARECRNSLILGVRKFEQDIPLRSKVGNVITRKVFSMTTGTTVSDTQSGLRAFTRDLVDKFSQVQGERYEYEIRVLMTCAKEEVPIREVEIETIYHDKDNSCSHFHTIRDSFRIYKEIFKFCFVSASSFVLDYLLFCLLYFISGKNAGMILLANMIARVGSGTYNYLMNTKVVFHEGLSLRTAGRYLLLALGILFLNNVLLKQYLVLFPNPQIAKIVTEATLFVISFTFQKYVVYSGANTTCFDSKKQNRYQLKEQLKHEKIY